MDKKKRLKPLLPTLKEKKRYLAFEIVSKAKIKDFSEVSKAIQAAVLAFVGTKGAADLGIIMIPEKFDPATQKGLIKVSHNGLDILRASFAQVIQIGNEPAIVRSIGASGILEKAAVKYVGG